MLTLHALTTGYRHTIISQHLNATLPQGTLTALLGTNGAGKSTLLRTLARFQPPLAGSISWQGTDTAQLSARQLARTMSVVLTFKPEAEALTAAEVVEMGRIPYTTMLSGTTEADRQAVEQAMQLTHTTPFAHRPISTLSDGERQRVFIAKALAQNTPVILLDEPTAFLDFPAKIATMRLLKNWRTTHKRLFCSPPTMWNWPCTWPTTCGCSTNRRSQAARRNYWLPTAA